MSFRTRLTAAAAALAATSIALVGCSSASETSNSTDSSGGGESIPLVVTVAPIQFETVYIAEREGFFDEVGLDVTIKPGTDPASNLAQIVSGEVDITTASWGIMSNSIAEGLPVKVLAGNAYTDPELQLNAIVVKADSPIQEVADLEGKTVGVNGVRSGGSIPMLQAAQDAGIDPESISEVAVPYSGMQAALEGDVVDAVLTADAGLAQLLADGFRVLIDPVAVYQANLPITLWAASDQWLAENPETALNFIAAMEKAAEVFNDPANQELRREINAEINQIDIADAPTVFAPARLAIDLEAGQNASDAMVELGFAEAAPLASEIVWSETPLVEN